MVGDSFTQGYCVDPEKNIGALIRSRYPKTLNFGLGGSGPLTMLAVFREYVEPLKPKLILWIYTERTIGRSFLEGPFLNYLNPEYKQGLFTMQPELDLELQKFLNFVTKEQISWYESTSNKWLNALLLRGVRFKISEILKSNAAITPIRYDIFSTCILLENTLILMMMVIN